LAASSNSSLNPTADTTGKLPRCRADSLTTPGSGQRQPRIRTPMAPQLQGRPLREWAGGLPAAGLGLPARRVFSIMATPPTGSQGHHHDFGKTPPARVPKITRWHARIVLDTAGAPLKFCRLQASMSISLESFVFSRWWPARPIRDRPAPQPTHTPAQSSSRSEDLLSNVLEVSAMRGSTAAILF